jgi:hypothetical protein
MRQANRLGRADSKFLSAGQLLNSGRLLFWIDELAIPGFEKRRQEMPGDSGARQNITHHPAFLYQSVRKQGTDGSARAPPPHIIAVSPAFAISMSLSNPSEKSAVAM